MAEQSVARAEGHRSERERSRHLGPTQGLERFELLDVVRGVALLGVEGLAVIDTPDVLLVTKLERSSDVRAIVARLKARGRTDVT